MKSYTVVIEPEAQQDLTQIYRFISQNDSPLPAKRFLSKLQNTIESLSYMPQRHRKSYYIDDEHTHDMIVHGYTICYTIREEKVHILTVFRQRSYP